MRSRYTIQGLLLAVLVAAWLVSCFMAGGTFLHLPIGCLVIAAVGLISWTVQLRRQPPTIARRLSWLPVLLVSPMLIAAIIIYCAWWPEVLFRFRLATARQRAFQQTNHLALSAAAQHLWNTHGSTIPKNGSRQLMSTEWPEEFHRLDPQRVTMEPDIMTLSFGRLGLGDGFHVLVFRTPLEGNGTERLASGVWYLEPGSKPRKN